MRTVTAALALLAAACADPISNDVMHVIAWYKLMRGDPVIARGPTSLLLVRDGPRWAILKDHSS